MKTLEELKGQYGELGNNVIEWLEEQVEPKYSAKAVLNDLMEHGCQSGMVGHLIYTTLIPIISSMSILMKSLNYYRNKLRKVCGLMIVSHRNSMITMLRTFYHG